MTSSGLQAELKKLKEENDSINLKLKRVALYCQDLKEQKEGLQRKLGETEEELKQAKEKIEILEKKIEDNYIFNNNLNYNNEYDSNTYVNPNQNEQHHKKRSSFAAIRSNIRSSIKHSISSNFDAYVSNNPIVEADEKLEKQESSDVFEQKGNNLSSNFNYNNKHIYNQQQHQQKHQHQHQHDGIENINISLISLAPKKQDTRVVYLLKKLKEEIEGKNNEIIRLNEEITQLRIKHEEEKSKEISNYQFVLNKISKHNIDTEFIRVTKELSSWKLNYHKKESSMKSMEKEIEALKEKESKLSQNLKTTTIEKPTSSMIYNLQYEEYYKNLNILRQTSLILEFTLRENRKLRYFQSKYRDDIAALNDDLLIQKNKLVELESKTEKQDIQLKGNASELEYLREKNTQFKKVIDDMQLSKKIYHVTYYYLGLGYDAKIVFEKSDEDYSFKIITKTSTRKLILSDYDATQVGNDCFKLRNRVNNEEEEYYSTEISVLMSDFELFKKKYIETAKFFTQGAKVVSEKKEKDVKKIEDKEKKFLDIFGM